MVEIVFMLVILAIAGSRPEEVAEEDMEGEGIVILNEE